ncbi:hypothetical protein B0T24DRAFT_237853 [Lasiosphaeria ovina]|uniref:Heterokaryon incompatibility domain-containing protein n=1 Tax=Lasiosphaeria ovina TaxID=92902 RepID=A0AAE0KJC8_9PEZI|nr:hypothetical protein B0T24DRAFT_237853 [Lasiosphaeria ovina]
MTWHNAPAISRLRRLLRCSIILESIDPEAPISRFPAPNDLTPFFHSISFWLFSFAMGENGAYVYSPLEAGSFRLLKFAPTESEDGLVEVELSTFPLVNTPPFNVLSYRWGLSTTWRYLYCHGQKIRLRQSALDAIVAVRSQKSQYPELLWVDVVCTNQEDIAEISTMVSLSRPIMLAANCTIMSMGSQTDVTQLAFDLLADLALARMSVLNDTSESPLVGPVSRPALEEYRRLVSSNVSTRWPALEDLLASDRNPFERTWALGDVVFSRHLDIVCGSHRMAWSQVCYGLDAYVNLGHPNMIRNPLAYSMLDLYSLCNGDPKKRSVSWSRVLEITRPLTATEPKDKIFATIEAIKFLNPAQAQTLAEAFPVYDYTLMPSQLFDRSAKLISTDSGFGPFLCALSMVEEVKAVQDRAIGPSSWVPDWSIPLERYRLNSDDNPFAAADGRAILLIIDPAAMPMSLTFRGCIVDEIAHVAGYLMPRRPGDKFDIGGANNIIFAEWYEWAEAIAGPQYSAAGQRNLLLLHWAETIRAHGKLSVAPFSQQIQSSDELAKTARAWLDYLETEGQEATEDVRAFYAECIPAHGRRFGLTKRGHFCLVPEKSQPGDHIFVPFGSKVPFVVTGKGYTGTRRSYGNVGECYLHGAMFGEALTWPGVVELDIVIS